MRKSKGFNLIELMIVVAIVGIVATVAVNIYRNNILAANRTEARAALTQAAGSLEKCRSLYGSYNHASCAFAGNFPIATDSNFYSITAALGGSTFTLTATPVAGETQSNDADCTTLTLTNTGIKGATGADTTVCW